MAIVNFRRSTPSLFENKWVSNLFWGLPVLLFLYLLQLGPLIQSDTATYLQHAHIRSALYPLILQINTLLFGTDQYLGLVFFQLILGFFSCAYLAFKISKIFDLKKWVLFPLFFILLTPYFGSSHFGNLILTEAICYPLFLLTFACLLEGMILRKNRSLLYALFLTAALIMTRRQFLFLYPVLAGLLLYIVLFDRKRFRAGLLIFSFMVSIVSTNVLERTYQYLANGQFATIPFTGIQLIAAPLYLSKDSDIQIFPTDVERDIFKKARLEMDRKHCSIQALKAASFSLETYTHFYEHYNTVSLGIAAPILYASTSDLYLADKTAIQMAIRLIISNFPAYFKLYMMNLIFNMGGEYFCLLLTLIAICASVQHYRYRDRLSLSCLLVLSLTGANYCLVALVEPILRRYSVYTDTLLISILLLCIIRAFQASQKPCVG